MLNILKPTSLDEWVEQDDTVIEATFSSLQLIYPYQDIEFKQVHSMLYIKVRDRIEEVNFNGFIMINNKFMPRIPKCGKTYQLKML